MKTLFGFALAAAVITVGSLAYAACACGTCVCKICGC
jgi:hypothetical protein